MFRMKIVAMVLALGFALAGCGMHNQQPQTPQAGKNCPCQCPCPKAQAPAAQ